MKKNIFKKIVASLATVAMAAGLFAAAPAEEAKAADAKKEIILFVSGDLEYDTVYLDFDGQNAGITSEGEVVTNPVGWGRDMYKFTKSADNTYKITVNGEASGDTYCNMQFLFTKEGQVAKGLKYFPQNGRDMYNSNSTLYFSVSLAANDWSELSASDTDPTAIKASEVIALIDAIGTVALSDESLAKIKAAEEGYAAYKGEASDITNYDKLTAARAAYDKLVKAEEAKAAGTLTVYVKNADWTKMNVYGWDGAEFGKWPGKELTALKANEGWFSVSFDITKATNLIFNDGSTQTVDWTNVAAGTYWVVLSEKGDDGKYLVNNVATKAPADWKDEAAEKLENEAATQAPTKAPETTDDTVQTGDSSSVVIMLAVAAVAAGMVVASKKKTICE